MLTRHQRKAAQPKPIRVGQRLIRWDGVTGSVGLNSLGKRSYASGEGFNIHWSDGETDPQTIETLADEGIRRGKGVMVWAR